MFLTIEAGEFVSLERQIKPAIPHIDITLYLFSLEEAVNSDYWPILS